MPQTSISILGIPGLPEVRPGDDLASTIASTVRLAGDDLRDQDIVVIAQKIVSKAEGRLVRLSSITPSPAAAQWAKEFDKDARVVEVVLAESRRVVRMERGIVISETSHGFVCANAGVDTSNVPDGYVSLLPEDPDKSAARIRDSLERELGVKLAVVICDTFGRPWREGLVNVAIGVAGIAPLIDYRGQVDSYGRALHVTVIAIADELASAAELVMKKRDGVPVAVVRGFEYERRAASSSELIRHESLDLFR